VIIRALASGGQRERLPTFTLPATAPPGRSEKWRTSLLMRRIRFSLCPRRCDDNFRYLSRLDMARFRSGVFSTIPGGYGTRGSWKIYSLIHPFCRRSPRHRRRLRCQFLRGLRVKTDATVCTMTFFLFFLIVRGNQDSNLGAGFPAGRHCPDAFLDEKRADLDTDAFPDRTMPRIKMMPRRTRSH